MRLLILPGMGASAAMYDGLKHKLGFPVTFLNWPEYHGEKTYSEVARRIIKENNIGSDDAIGGSSLGGMVALEIASQCDAKAVVLLGSAVNRREVKRLLVKLSPFATVAPIGIAQALVGKSRNPVRAMFAESDPGFIRAMCKHLPSWNGCNGQWDRIFRLHGKKDCIIPCPPTGCNAIETAGHLLAITHAPETAAFLQRVYEQLGTTEAC